MSTTTLGFKGLGGLLDGNDRNMKTCQKQLKTIKTGKDFTQSVPYQNVGNGIFGMELMKSMKSIDPMYPIVSQIYNPMNLACIICKKFENHQNALVRTFVNDLGMFEYMYEFLPKNIVVMVLNQIPLDKAVDIVERHQSTAFIYDQVDPMLYVIRYFSNSKIRDPVSRDPYCIEFNKSIIPNNSVLDFVLRCKKHLSNNDFLNLVKMLC
jgi:hypothetical protein